GCPGFPSVFPIGKADSPYHSDDILCPFDDTSPACQRTRFSATPTGTTISNTCAKTGCEGASFPQGNAGTAFAQREPSSIRVCSIKTALCVGSSLAVPAENSRCPVCPPLADIPWGRPTRSHFITPVTAPGLRAQPAPRPRQQCGCPRSNVSPVARAGE